MTDTPTVSIRPPNGLSEICSTFGDIFHYILPDQTLDPHWQSEFLQRLALPFPRVLSWDHTRNVDKFTCHKALASVFAGVLAQIQESGLQSKISSFGGCFSFRQQRTGAKLSTHAWGIAIDLNPESNEQGTAGNMDPGLISIFCDAGFEWGGFGTENLEIPCTFNIAPDTEQVSMPPICWRWLPVASNG